MLKTLAAAFGTALLSSCGFVYDEEIDGPYRLIAVDTLDQMSVNYDLGDGSSIGRIDKTVIAVGFDDDFIVAQRHPNGERSTTEYYYLVRSVDSKFADPKDSVRGPFTEEEFHQQKSQLGLPEFTRVLTQLK